MTYWAKVRWCLAAVVLAGCGRSAAGGGGEGADVGCAGLLGCECVEGRCSVGECIAGVCADCRRGEAGCACRANGTCGAGLRCGAGGTCDVCAAGAEGCACGAGDGCDAGLRCGSGGTCEACPTGAEGCSCGAGKACGAGLRCGPAGTCVTCADGVEGCPCGAGGTCNAGLRCEAAVCVADACAAGAEGCHCRAAEPTCDGTSTCDASNRCRACAPDVAGCPCGAANACAGGLICDAGTLRCRAAMRCADLRASGACVEHQACADGSGMDATCEIDACEVEFKWDGRAGACVGCASPGCASEPTCADLAAGCSKLHRSCDQLGRVASCGPCEAFYAEPAVGAGAAACVEAPLCGADTCALDEYCDVTDASSSCGSCESCDPSSATRTCAPLPCPPGQARTYDFGSNIYGACEECGLDCRGAGYTGRVWPFQTHFGVCICETRPGFFVPAGVSGQAVQCDADGDGWVRGDADDPTVRCDPALLANSRCDIRKVDQVRLVDEYGIGAEIRSCSDGLVLTSSGAPCTDAVPLRLLETARNDTGSVNPTKLPAYGGPAGRTLEPSELNALTKACVSLAADYNDNGVDDIREAQARGVTSADDQARLASFAYFLELADAYYEDGQGSGTLVIRERSRCSTDFPLRYDLEITDPSSAADRYDPGVGRTYWRNCDRRRDAAYSQSSTNPGYDFAQWSCAAASGTCEPALPFARAGAPVVNPDPRKELVRGIGLCELRGAKPGDGGWRGFNHHSQFKCVNVTAAPKESFDRPTEAFAAANEDTNDKLVFNRCFAQPCTGGACRTKPGSGPQTATPSVRCVAVAPEEGAAGFAGVGFHGYARGGLYPTTAQSYRNGCVSEDEESRSAIVVGGDRIGSYLCPYPEYCNTLNKDHCANSGALERAARSFGRFSCYGMDPNFLWWDGVESNVQRATLRWGASDSDKANGFLR